MKYFIAAFSFVALLTVQGCSHGKCDAPKAGCEDGSCPTDKEKDCKDGSCPKPGAEGATSACPESCPMRGADGSCPMHAGGGGAGPCPMHAGGDGAAPADCPMHGKGMGGGMGHGHGAGPCGGAGQGPGAAGLNPVQQEMRMMVGMLARAVMAIGMRDVSGVQHDLHRLHAAKEATTAAVTSGTYKLPKNPENVARFTQLDEDFHVLLGKLVAASQANDVQGTAEAVGQVLANCTSCHSEFRP